jgi:hypothetical protein
VARSKRKWPVIAGIAFIVIFIGAMAWSTLGNARFHCQVCITYNGQSLCRDGAATTKTEAERIAADGICTDLSHGMTELMQCQQNAPRQVIWKP